MACRLGNSGGGVGSLEQTRKLEPQVHEGLNRLMIGN